MKNRNHLHFLIALALAIGCVLPLQGKRLIAVSTGMLTKPNPNFTSHGPFNGQMKDGAVHIDQMHHRTGELNDYQLEFEITVFKRSSPLHEKGNLFFKKPKLMRLEETGTYKHGAVAVISKDGKAHGHLGGAMKLVKMTVSLDSPELRASNGYPLKDSDFHSITGKLKKLLAEGKKSRVTERPLQVEGLTQEVYVLEIYHAQDPNNVLKRVYVDPNSHLPVRWDDFDYTDHSMTEWKNVKVNKGLSDDLFKI